MKYEIISSDTHLDLPWMPRDLFTSNARASLKSRMPAVKDGPDGPQWQTEDGVFLGFPCGVGGMGRKFKKGTYGKRIDRMAEAGIYAEGEHYNVLADPEQRLKYQDADGIQAEVLFGLAHVARHVPQDDVLNEMYRVYNDWLADFCDSHPDRYIGIGCLNNRDPKAAAEQVQQIADHGLRGAAMIIVPAGLEGASEDAPPLWHPAWDVLWRTASERDVLLHFHTSGGSWKLNPLHQDISEEAREAARGTFWAVFQISGAEVLAALIMSGAAERYPNLKFIMAEIGVGWIPYLLERMDYEFEDKLGRSALKMKPSEYWHRQFYASFLQDRVAVKLVETLGPENLLWGSDFPHMDCLWPDSRQFIDEQLAGVSSEVKRKIVCENAMRLYGLDKK